MLTPPKEQQIGKALLALCSAVGARQLDGGDLNARVALLEDLDPALVKAACEQIGREQSDSNRMPPTGRIRAVAVLLGKKALESHADGRRVQAVGGGYRWGSGEPPFGGIVSGAASLETLESGCQSLTALSGQEIATMHQNATTGWALWIPAGLAPDQHPEWGKYPEGFEGVHASERFRLLRERMGQ